MWRELVGKWNYEAGVAGTVTLPEGAIVTQIVASSTAGGTFKIFGGDSVPVAANLAPLSLRFNHTNCIAGNSGGVVADDADIVFTGTVSYFVEYFINI